MRQDFDLTNFTAGELSPRMKGRIDYEKYFNGCATLLNMVVLPQGGATRRPGTALIASVANQAVKPRVRRFQFSTVQSYICEFGAGLIRLYRNDGQLLNPQPVTNAQNNGAGLVRLTLASAAGIYTGNSITVSGVLGTIEANGTWLAQAVTNTQAITGTANNGSGGIRLTMASTANFINGGNATVAGVGGTIEANGTWRIVIVSGTQIDLQASVFADAFSSGGTISGNDAFNVDLQGTSFQHAYTGGGETSTIVQIPTPYGAGDLAGLYFTQSDDTLYITHPNYPAATLTRNSGVDWSYQALVFRDGPYLDVNVSTTTLTVGSSTFNGGRLVFNVGIKGRTLRTNAGGERSITLQASSTLGINSTETNVGQGFLSSDVGRHLRFKLLSSWCWSVIEEVLSPTEVVVTIQPTVSGGAWGNIDGAPWEPNTYYPVGVVVTNNGHTWQCVQAGESSGSGGPQSEPSNSTEVPDGTNIWNFTTGTVPTSTTFWQLGKWTPGVYPFVCTLWQQRLLLLGTSYQPNAVEGSVIGDFTNFAPTQQDGTVVDTNALSFVISDDQVNSIQWVKTAGAAQAAQLAMGTIGEEQIMQAYSTAQPLTPTNIQVYPETSVGSAPVEPLRIGKSLVFADRPGRKLIEWTFLWQVNGYNPVELTQQSEHITLSGVTAMVYAQAPHRLIVALLENGSLLFCTYDKDENIFAPTRQVLGGNYYGGPPVIESVDLIPSQDTSYDEIWLSVLRTVNNQTFRSIEVVTRWFENSSVPQEFAVFLDCSISLVLPTPAAYIAIGNVSNTAATPDAAPIYTGNAYLFASAAAFTEASVGQLVRVNGGIVLVQQFVSTTQVIGTTLRGLTNTVPAAPGNWTIAPPVTTVSGLSDLEGETLGILGDGADLGTATVVYGSLPLPAPGATMVTVGEPYCSGFVTMPFEPQRAASIASSGKMKRIDTMWVRFFESLGCTFGRRTIDSMTFVQKDKSEPLLTRSAGMPMGQAPALFSGARKLMPQGGYDEEGQMVVTTTSPLPLTVLSIFARGETGDMPRGPS